MKTKILLSIVVLIFCYFPKYVFGNTNLNTPVSLKDIKSDYKAFDDPNAKKVNVLIVPGHEPNHGGTEFSNLKERDLVVKIGNYLDQFLQDNPHYHVIISRDNQNWNPIFTDYFQTHLNDILVWEKAAKKKAAKIFPIQTHSVVTVKHVNTPLDLALHLYGITKWANENDIDLTLHLHLNDYPRYDDNLPGKYSGLVLYTPAIQNMNSPTTKALAKIIFKRLTLYNPKSNLSLEAKGIIDDPKLIAVGVNNTSRAASILLEYGYIYEKRFTNTAISDLALKDLAYQTYLGIEDFFNQKNTNQKNQKNTDQIIYDPTSLYIWNTRVTNPNADAKDIYALQTALILDGDFYPKNKNSCNHNGIFDLCTEKAIQKFQKKNKITDEDVFGQKTFVLLNNIYTRKN